MGNAHPQGGAAEGGVGRNSQAKRRSFGRDHGLAKPKQQGEDSNSNAKSGLPRNYSFGGTTEDFDSSLANLAFASTTTHKGLSNNSGDNNCFLNSTIQALWHLGPFRVELQDFVASHSYLIDARYQQNLINNSNRLLLVPRQITVITLPGQDQQATTTSYVPCATCSINTSSARTR